MTRYLYRVSRWNLLVVVASLVLAPGAHACEDTTIAAGAGCFVFTNWDGPPLEVWYQASAVALADGPAVFVMHGTRRDADRYRDQWLAAAEASNLVVLVPRFSRSDFAGASGYNLGGLLDTEPGTRAFDALEPIFRTVLQHPGRSRDDGYYLYGHSAGAQFVHRYVLFADAPGLKAAVAANSGWYTMPTPAAAFPYGLHGPVGELANRERAFAVPLIVALGELDNDPAAPYLRHTDEAEAQGPHRLARGLAFIAAAEQAAQRNDWPLRWQLERVAGAGHDNAAMVDVAVRWIQHYEEQR